MIRSSIEFAWNCVRRLRANILLSQNTVNKINRTHFQQFFTQGSAGKGETAQINEAFCKIQCHNICVLIQSMFEFGIVPQFCGEIAVDQSLDCWRQKMKPRDNNTARLMFTLAGLALIVWLIVLGLHVHLSTYDPYSWAAPSEETDLSRTLYLKRRILYHKVGSIAFSIGILLALVGFALKRRSKWAICAKP